MGLIMEIKALEEIRALEETKAITEEMVSMDKGSMVEIKGSTMEAMTLMVEIKEVLMVIKDLTTMEVKVVITILPTHIRPLQI